MAQYWQAAKHTPAQHVFTCEADPTLAAAACDVVQSNNLDRNVTVIGPRFSTELRVGMSGDLPCPADVIVMEIFDSMLVRSLRVAN
jgi:predicted RNA methylase